MVEVSVSVGAGGTSDVVAAFGSEVAVGEPSVLVLLDGASMVEFCLAGCNNTGNRRAR